MISDSSDTYVFGYGSLIYRCGFSYDSCFNGYIRGYHRRLYHKETYHRGTESFPGRCALIIPTGFPEDVVHGVCYKIPASQRDSVLSLLDERERNLERIELPVYVNHKIVTTAHVYIQNRCELEEHEKDDEYTAQVIAKACGSSGTNCEYLFKLYHSLLQMNALDMYLIRLYHRVYELINNYKKRIDKPVKRELINRSDI